MIYSESPHDQSWKHYVSFCASGVPRTKGSARALTFPGKKFPIVINDNAKNKTWARHVSHAARVARGAREPLTGAVILSLRFSMPAPQSLSKRRSHMAIKRPDLDKLIRSVKDALSGILYTDDSQVVAIEATKAYDKQAGVCVTCLEVIEPHPLSYQPK